MKANESVKNYAASVRMYTNYTVREIKKICKEIGPRIAGSEAEHKAHAHLAEQMKSCCDEVAVEEFTVAREALMSFIRVCGILVAIAMVFSFVNLPVVALVVSVIAAVCLVCEFGMYKQFYDVFFKKYQSHNAIGVRKAAGETKQRIIFSGHVDSSHEWTFTHLGGAPLLYVAGVWAIVGMLYCLVYAILATFNVGSEELLTVLKYVQIAFIPGVICAIIFINFRRTVEGANDNLTGAVSSIAIMKYLEDNNIRFENTEVICMATGSEESGLRGAKDYAKRHHDELTEIPTIFIGLETFRDYDNISICKRDLSGTVSMDARVSKLVKKAGEDAGVDLPYISVYLGASDAAAIQQSGVPAVTLSAMNPGPPRYYHTRRDTADNMNIKTVEKCLDIALRALFIYDEEGLKEEY
ncbi:MAG: M20/M25/M40 family metallo-hydrolase [Clostridia bacterium]|nr:M20/M25/M40 family metallo-hydrolase [Clostridia bacterium]